MNVSKRLAASLSKDLKAEIESFLEGNGGLVFHRVDVNEVASRYSGSMLYYVLGYQHGNLHGVCPLHTFRNSFTNISYSGLAKYEIPYGGWIKDSFCSQDINMAMLKLGLNESIEYTSSSFIYGNSIDDLSNRMKETILIDLDQQSVDQLWGSIGAKRRNMIRKAQKNDVLVRQLSDGDLSLFYDLLISMNQRTGMKSKPLEFYQDIYRVLSPKKACVMAAYFDGKIIATIMIIGNNTMWHYWQGATDTSYNLGAMDLLLWESIIHAKASGGEAFDLCVIDRVKLPHLAKYKLSFGGVPVHYLVKGKKRIIARILTKLIHARTHKVMNAN